MGVPYKDIDGRTDAGAVFVFYGSSGGLTASGAEVLTQADVIGSTRNDYDRFHADARTSQERADDYLATYIENCVKGFADQVLVPDEEGVPPDSFMASNFDLGGSALGYRLDKLLFSAVSSATAA